MMSYSRCDVQLLSSNVNEGTTAGNSNSGYSNAGSSSVSSNTITSPAEMSTTGGDDGLPF